MKLYIIILALAVVTTTGVFAQPIQGMRAGIGFTNLSGPDVTGNQPLAVFNGGYFFDHAIGDVFSIQHEFNLGFKGASNDIVLKSFPFTKIHMAYLQMPLLLKFSTRALGSGMRPSFYAGPAVDVFIVQDADGERIETDPDNMRYSKVQEPKSVTADMVLGASVTFNNKYLVDLRYEKGLHDVYDGVKAKSWGLSVTLGILFLSE